MPRAKPAVPLEKVSVHIPHDVLDAGRKAACRAGTTFSRWAVDAMRAKLVDGGA